MESAASAEAVAVDLRQIWSTIYRNRYLIGIIIVFSLIQAWLDHRKHERMDAAKRRAASVDWRGGW